MQPKNGIGYVRDVAKDKIYVASNTIVKVWDRVGIPDRIYNEYKEVTVRMKPSGNNTISVPVQYVEQFLDEISKENVKSVSVDGIVIDLESRKKVDQDFKTNLVKTTMEWPSGCKEGKEEFLAKVFGGKDKIPQLPSPRRRITIEVDANSFNERGYWNQHLHALGSVENKWPNTFKNAVLISTEDL